MGKLKLVALFFTLGLFIACNFTEEIHFNEDGSGKLSINFDANELMAMAGSLDSLKQEEVVDSTLVFKDLLELKKDSIAQLSAEEQAKLKKLEPFSMNVVMNPEAQEMKFKLFSDFKNVSEMNDAFNSFQSASSLGPMPGTGSAAASPLSVTEPTTQVNYSFSGNTFSRTITVVNQELFQKGLDSLAGAELFLSGSTYTFKYHFPRRVKKVNVEGATFFMDGKTMIYEVDFLNMMKTPDKMAIEVELED